MLLCLLSLALAAPTFVVEDQFGQPLDQEQVLGAERTVLLVSTRREHADVMTAWADALREHAVSAAIIGWVDLEALPFFVPKALITRAIRQDLPTTPVVCDWDGIGKQALGLMPSEQLQVRVLDGTGQPLLTVEGAPERGPISQVLAMLPPQE